MNLTKIKKMFNNLFGGKKSEEARILALEEQIKTLQTRVNELGSENKNLSKRLSKQDMRAKKALSDKQEVDAALKKAKVKIETLEHELKNLKKQGSGELFFKKSTELTNDKSLEMLFKIGSARSKNEDLLSAYLRPDDSIADLPDLPEFERTANLNKDILSLVQKIKSPTGMALFCDMSQPGISPMIAVPPFPITGSGWKIDSAFDIKQLHEILSSDPVICIVFAHAGETFIGVSNREAFIDHRIVRSSVKGKHKKGGWSQRRFERLIAEDIRNHAGKSKTVFESLVKEYKEDIKMVVGSGEYNLAKEITGDCGYHVLFKSINAKIEKHDIDRIRMLVWSSKWYELP